MADNSVRSVGFAAICLMASLGLGGAAFAAVEAPTIPVPKSTLPAPDHMKVAIETTEGEIVVELETKRAPITTANFLHYVDNHRLDRAVIYRSMRSTATDGFIQASVQQIKYPPIAHEPTSKTGLSHTNGAVSMGRYEPGTAAGEFVFCVGDMTYMDAGKDPNPKSDQLGYAVFGKVVKGMNVVRKILHAKIDPKATGGWKGELLKDPVTIIEAHRVK